MLRKYSPLSQEDVVWRGLIRGGDAQLLHRLKLLIALWDMVTEFGGTIKLTRIIINFHTKNTTYTG